MLPTPAVIFGHIGPPSALACFFSRRGVGRKLEMMREGANSECSFSGEGDKRPLIFFAIVRKSIKERGVRV
jgi:hypothetical protein